MKKRNGIKNYIFYFAIFSVVAFALINWDRAKENPKDIKNSTVKNENSKRRPASLSNKEIKPLEVPNGIKTLQIGNDKADRSQFLESIAEVRAELSADTISWSATLPEPKTDLQRVIWLFAQIGKEGDDELNQVVLNSSVQFLSVDAQTADYFFKTLNGLRAGADQNVKNLFFEFSKTAFPDVSVGNLILHDHRACTENPQQCSTSNQKNLENLVLSASDISWDRKRALLNF